MMGTGFGVVMVTVDLVPTGEFKLREGLPCPFAEVQAEVFSVSIWRKKTLTNDFPGAEKCPQHTPNHCFI